MLHGLDSIGLGRTFLMSEQETEHRFKFLRSSLRFSPKAIASGVDPAPAVYTARFRVLGSSRNHE